MSHKTVANQFAVHHFGRKAVAAMARKGVRVVGMQACPDKNGSFFNTTTGYKVDDNGTGRVWTFQQVREAAQ